MTDLLDYCHTDTEKKYVKAYLECNNFAEVSRLVGKTRATVREQILRVQARAAKKEKGEHVDKVPQGYAIKGVSTLFNGEGGVTAQWVKTDRDAQLQIEAVEKAVASICKALPKAKVVKAPKNLEQDLCSLYTFTDYHLGMMAWDKESGDDWDIDIAQDTLATALEQMAQGPESELGILNIQGDFCHWDGLDAVTPAHKHVLDADTRFDKLVEISLRMCINGVQRLLEKHKTVRVIICEGNHDLASSVWLRKSLKAIFSSNKRVSIDDTAFPYYAYLHGQIMLGFHHGHKMKNKALPTLFSSEPRYREMWGKAKYTYIHTGHYHHAEQDMAENGGAIVERHPTLSARDAYASRGGYVSWRAARAITYHKQKGEVSRITVVP
tara:strand:- start:998 stop:2140 length:1143 start_codon:yes stop_codon:yes gene_type:complete